MFPFSRYFVLRETYRIVSDFVSEKYSERVSETDSISDLKIALNRPWFDEREFHVFNGKVLKVKQLIVANYD